MCGCIILNSKKTLRSLSFATIRTRTFPMRRYLWSGRTSEGSPCCFDALGNQVRGSFTLPKSKLESSFHEATVPKIQSPFGSEFDGIVYKGSVRIFNKTIVSHPSNFFWRQLYIVLPGVNINTAVLLLHMGEHTNSCEAATPNMFVVVSSSFLKKAVKLDEGHYCLGYFWEVKACMP